jgi:uncharacterized protein
MLGLRTIMSAVADFSKRRPLSTYFVLTFMISWGAALVAIGGSGGMAGTTPESDPRFVYALIAMLAGPPTAGLLLTTLVHGRAGLLRFRSRLLAWRVGITWYLVALLTAPVLMTVTLLVLSSTSDAFLPGILTTDSRRSILVIGAAVGLSAGFFEELGWTGFAIPTALRRWRMPVTGLVVGVLWSAWHLLPNVWSATAAAGELATPVYLTGVALGVFVGYLTAFRVLMVWVYERTESLLLGMLMHASFTTSLLVLNPPEIAGADLLIYSSSLSASLWVVVAGVAIARRRGRRPGHATAPAP